MNRKTLFVRRLRAMAGVCVEARDRTYFRYNRYTRLHCRLTGHAR